MYKESNRSFFFGITVSEIAFILFFLLLLFTFFSVLDLTREKKRAEASREAAEAGQAEATAALQTIQETFAIGAELDLDEALTVLQAGAKAIEELESHQEHIKKLEAENVRLQQEYERQREMSERQERQLGETRGQLANLQERAGVGDPPCWVADESGEIEYLFRVTLFGNETVEVNRAAPARREHEYFALPSVSEITGGRLEMAQFESLSLPIYQTGENSIPKCRHFVRLDFADRDACRLFLIVERYYYKSVHSGDSGVCTD